MGGGVSLLQVTMTKLVVWLAHMWTYRNIQSELFHSVCHSVTQNMGKFCVFFVTKYPKYQIHDITHSCTNVSMLTC